jgi:hypothetical protein
MSEIIKTRGRTGKKGKGRREERGKQVIHTFNHVTVFNFHMLFSIQLVS